MVSAELLGTSSRLNACQIPIPDPVPRPHQVKNKNVLSLVVDNLLYSRAVCYVKMIFKAFKVFKMFVYPSYKSMVWTSVFTPRINKLLETAGRFGLALHLTAVVRKTGYGR